MEKINIILIIVIGILAIPSLFFVHCILEYSYLAYARRYCRKHGLTFLKYRCAPWFENSMKTEYSLVEVVCLNEQKQQQLIRLLICFFGIHKILSIEDYNEKP